MHRFLKLAGLAAAAVLALLVLALAIIAATFDPNDYKSTVIDLVQAKTGRTLAVPGQLKLTLFPRLGAQLGKVSLSERGGPAEFVGAERAHLSLALLPLLASKVVVDQIDVDGLRANIVRHADGRLSFDDLLATKPADGAAKDGGSARLSFAIDGIRIRDALLRIDDRKQGRKIEVAGLQLDTGPVSDQVDSKLSLKARIAVDQPGLNATVAVASGFRLDLAKQRFALDGLDATLDGAITAANKLTLGAAGHIEFDLAQAGIASNGLKLSAVYGFAGSTIDARLALPAFRSASKQLKLPGLALALSVDDIKGELKASGSLAGDVALDLGSMRLHAPQLALAFDGSKGGRALGGKFALGLDADLPQQTVSTTLKGKLDESTIDARAAMRGFATPAFDFRLDIDSIDADRYRAPATAAAAGKAAAPARSAAGPAAGADAPVDLSALNGLALNGSVKVGRLRAGGLNMAGLSAELRSGGKRFAVSPLSASLYGGSLNGALKLEFPAGAKAPAIALDATLAGIALGDLLKDVMNKAPIDGKGDVQLAVTTRGDTVGAIKRALGGSARLRLADGSVSGFNLARIVRDAKARLDAVKGNAPSTGTASVQDKTDFTELTASFKIANGVARNDDLMAKTPLLRLTGAGDVDLGQDRLDYLAKATVVATLQGQGGPELDALKGVTVPVRLSGPFTAVGWQIDFKAMVTDSVRQKAQDKIKDKLKDALKGLFGK